MKKLQGKDLEKLSIIAETPLVHIQRLHSMGVLDDRAVFLHMMSCDFKRIKSRGYYTTKQIIAALANEYQVTEGVVKRAINSSKPKEFLCLQCGRLTDKKELKRNRGVCDQCLTNEIVI